MDPAVRCYRLHLGVECYGWCDMIPAEPTEKVCVRCGGLPKPITEFYRHSGFKDGHYNICIECAHADAKRRRNGGRVVRSCIYCGADITKLHWRTEHCLNPECVSKFKDKCLARARDYGAKYRANHSDERRAYVKRDLNIVETKPDKPKKVRYCRLCKKPIQNSNWFFCSDCLERLNDSPFRFDGGFLYA